MLLCGIHFCEALNFLKLQRFWVRAWLTIADLLESLEFFQTCSDCLGVIHDHCERFHHFEVNTLEIID